MKLNLVSVVGDFHRELTLIQMLRHYEPYVDNIYLNFYVTGKDVVREYQQFTEYLRKHDCIRKVKIILRSGQKFDWDKVTEFYNRTTRLDKDAWWIISDCDEFQIWPDRPRAIADSCEKHGFKFVTGGFVDRIGRGGEFPEIKGPYDGLDELFPLAGFFRYPMSQACPNKVVMVKGGQKVCSGQHYAVFPDGSTSWGDKHPLKYPTEYCFVQVHHFKWDQTVLVRLRETAKSKCKYSKEYARMWRALEDEEHVDIKNYNYYIEEFNPEKGFSSYESWDKVKSIILKV